MKHIVSKIWPWMLILVVWFVFAHPYFFKSLIPFPSTYLVSFFPPWSAQYGMPVKNNAMPDVITQIYPWKMLTIDSWKRGNIPLWNPYSFSGTHHAGNYQSAVFSPVNLLFFAVPFRDAWSLMILLQPLLAGIFMYLYLGSIDRSKSARLLGSVAFMFCGFLVVWMAYGTLGYAALTLPLALYAIERYSKARNWWGGPLLSITMFWSLVSGHFQISIYVSVFCLGYIIFRSLVPKSGKLLFPLLLYYLAGILLALPQLTQTLDAYVGSARSANFVKGEVIPWIYAVTLLAPDFFGNPVTRNDWFGHYAEWAGFIGTIPFLLASFVLYKKKTAHEWYFVVAGILALAFAFPTPLTDLLFAAKIPVLSTSAASRIIILFSFSFATLSAYGLDALRDSKLKKIASLHLPFILSTLVVVAGIWMLLLFGNAVPADKLAVAKRNFLLPTFLATLPLFAIWVSRRWPKKIYVVTAVLLLITCADVLRFAIKWMPFEKQELVYPQMSMLTFLKQRAGIDRVFGNFGNEMATTFGLQSIEGYDAVYQGRYGEFIGSAANGKIGQPTRSVVQIDKSGAHTERVLQLLGVRYYVHRLSDGRNVWAYPYWKYPYYKSIYKDEYYEVLENTKVLPRLFLTSSYKIASDKQQVLDLLYDQSAEQNTIILETDPGIRLKAGEGTLRVASYTPNEIVVETETSGQNLLFVSDVYNKGWKATVDGKHESIYRANYDFRAVVVPAGSHTVRFVYSPKKFTIALLIAGLVGVLVVAGAVRGLFYAHRNI